MSDPLLERNAGPVALAAGALFALVDLARWALQRPDDVLGMMTDPLFRVVNGGYFAAFVGLAVGLVALHERLAPHTGRLGLALLPCHRLLTAWPDSSLHWPAP